MSADTFDRIPQTDRDAIRGRSNPEPIPPQGTGDKTALRPRRFTFSGTSDPLNRIAPDPPTYLMVDYQRNQGAVSDYVANAIRALWDQHINPAEFSASWKDLGPVIKTIIAQHFDASAADAAAFYRNLSVVHGLPFPNVKPARFAGAHVNHMAGSVANGTFYHQLNTRHNTPSAASDIARNTMSGAGARFALNGARNTVTAAVARDPNAEGWERLIEPAACSYCASQAAKGPFRPGNMSFRAHDYCNCLALPLLRGATMNPNGQLRDEWNRITGTFTGTEARAAWDRYWSEHGDNTSTRNDSGTQEAGQAGQSASQQERRPTTLPDSECRVSQEGDQGCRARQRRP